ncbi:MAG TPA: exodeoxyribonuclease VII small subunit [Bdellovibrionota bacterium]|nr:exodeoxyribonuclease VII small subunit [Bdellovibrionota bacterium]
MAEKKFESALSELESIVSKLESEELPLEDSLELFEKGIKLSRLCSKKLAEAEKKVDALVAELAKDQPQETQSS